MGCGTWMEHEPPRPKVHYCHLVAERCARVPARPPSLGLIAPPGAERS